jgi:YidC/Oxa1 family membrane protein insertase
MEIITNAFNLILYQPLFNGLILLYQYLPGHDFGIAVIVLICLIRLILYPLMAQSIKFQKALQELQPKIQEIQQKYKADRERQTREIIALYKKEKINPLGSFLPFLIQLPILFALFWVFMAFKDGLDASKLTILYPFVSCPNLLEEPTLLGLINLTQPSLLLAALAGICQFFQTKMITPKQKSGGRQFSKKSDQMAYFSNLIQKQMLYFFPVFMVLILLRLPAVIGLYWIVTSLFSLGQQYIMLKKTAYAR